MIGVQRTISWLLNTPEGGVTWSVHAWQRCLCMRGISRVTACRACCSHDRAYCGLIGHQYLGSVSFPNQVCLALGACVHPFLNITQSTSQLLLQTHTTVCQTGTPPPPASPKPPFGGFPGARSDRADDLIISSSRHAHVQPYQVPTLVFAN